MPSDRMSRRSSRGSEALARVFGNGSVGSCVGSEMRRVMTVDLLVLDDFALDLMDATESRDFYDIAVERHGKGSIVITSNREPAEWSASTVSSVKPYFVLYQS